MRSVSAAWLVIAIVVVVAAAALGLLALHLWHRQAATGALNASEVESLVSNTLGGSWELLPNMSLTITPNPANGSFELVYLNGTSEVRRITPQISSSLQLLGAGGQPNGGYPLWIAVYTLILRKGNETYVTQIEVFKAANSTQARWTLSAVEQRYQVSANTTDDLTYLVVRQEIPFYNITETALVGVKGSYLIIILSDYPYAGEEQFVVLAEGLGSSLR